MHRSFEDVMDRVEYYLNYLEDAYHGREEDSSVIDEDTIWIPDEKFISP